jgi:multiple sugar transport system permease protein
MSLASTWSLLGNYAALLKDTTFWTALRNTAVFSVMDVPGNVILALLIALLLNRAFRGRELALSLFYMPKLLSISVLAFIWLWLYEPQWGLLNYYFSRIGIAPISWLKEPRIALPAIVVASIWWTVGNNVLLFLAGMRQISEDVYEAAEIDGATGAKAFFSITLPLLRPTSLFIVVMQVIASFQIFGQVYIMTGGGPAGSTRVLVQYIYEAGFRYFEMGYAAALSYVLFFIVMVFTALQFIVMKER